MRLHFWRLELAALLLASVSIVAVAPAGAAEPSTLAAGQILSEGQRIVSPDGRYQAIMQTDGNFVVYGPSGAAWSSGSGGTGAGGFAAMQTDGNLVVYGGSGGAVFSSSTAPSGNNQLVMQSDGNLVVYSSGGLALWSSYGGRTGNGEDTLNTGNRLQTGQFIRSRSGSFRAIMQTDGNFVLYGPNGATWSTGSGGVGNGVVADMQYDGNFVLYAPGPRAVYSSSTAPSSGNRLAVQDDGNLVIYEGSGAALWAKGQLLSNLPNPFPCSASDNSCLTYTGFDPNVSIWGQTANAKGNCTNFAAYRLQQRNATRLSGTGNAVTWRQRAIDQFGAGVSNNTPTVGSIAWWGTSAGAAGHVAYVEKVVDSQVWLSESVYDVGSRRRVLTAGAGGYPEYFLHIAPGT